MKQRSSIIWVILFWAGVVIILVWALGKSLGMIHSPAWVEMIPYFGGAASLVALGKYLQKIDTLCQDVGEMKVDLKEIQKKAICLGEAKCKILNTQ